MGTEQIKKNHWINLILSLLEPLFANEIYSVIDF